MHEDFEHPHRFVDQLLIGNHGAAAESMRADPYFDFLGNLLQFRQPGQRRLVKQVQQDVEPVDLGPDAGKFPEVLLHLLQRHLAGAPGSDEGGGQIDAVGNRHDGRRAYAPGGERRYAKTASTALIAVLAARDHVTGRRETTRGRDRPATGWAIPRCRSAIETTSFHRWAHPPQMKKHFARTSSASVTYVERQCGQVGVTGRSIRADAVSVFTIEQRI